MQCNSFHLEAFRELLQNYEAPRGVLTAHKPLTAHRKQVEKSASDYKKTLPHSSCAKLREKLIFANHCKRSSI